MNCFNDYFDKLKKTFINNTFTKVIVVIQYMNSMKMKKSGIEYIMI